MANETRRIWTTPYGTVCLRDTDAYGEPVIREFWAPPSGGYVREIDAAHPGTLGEQVFGRLAPQGHTLSSDPAGLLDLIRREYRGARDAAKRDNR